MSKATVVVDSIASRSLQWLGHIAALLLPAGLLAMSIFGVLSHSAHAQTTLSAKLAPDLVSAIDAPVLPAVNWAKDTGKGRFFKVIVVGAAGGGERSRSLRACRRLAMGRLQPEPGLRRERVVPGLPARARRPGAPAGALRGVVGRVRGALLADLRPAARAGRA